MNKSELIDAMADASELTKADAGRALDAFMSSVTDELKRDYTDDKDDKDAPSVALVGFGTFTVKNRAERKGRNPQTGAEITIKAAKVPSFKAGKSLKDSVNV
jgi:DNA-binding protein HU-beta